MATTGLLKLPQELKEILYHYAIREGSADDSPPYLDCMVKRHTTRNERWEWIFRYQPVAPIATYLSLMLCNAQLAFEIKDFLDRGPEQERQPARMTVLMDYPNVHPQWEHIPGPPDTIKTFDMSVKVDHMYHPALMTNGPNNAILKTTFEILKRYVHRGPHLARPSPLSRPLQLDTLRITLAPSAPFEEMTYVYGVPAQQLEILYTEFKTLMCRLGRSGVPFGSVGAFELRLEGKDWDRIPVTSNVWDEEDHTFFQSCSDYKWDAGEAIV